MEPLRVGERHRAALADLALELARRSAGLRRSLPDSILEPLAGLVRTVDCYYSNLIEGHDTHPVDIERALRADYSDDARKRDLQQEALAHIAVQRWIDGGALRGRSATAAAVLEVHARFFSALPEAMQWVGDTASAQRARVVPGVCRTQDVRVGRHVPVSPGAVPRFLQRYEDFYGSLGPSDRILAAAAAHHRLLWIHPFPDGNGRVARLVSHAMLLDVLDSGAVWSVARGLARSVAQYKTHLAECDLPRRNDLDGRGNLSEEALVAFTRYFLSLCIDQVRFMEGLVEPGQLRARVLRWADEEAQRGVLPVRCGAVLDAVLFRGALPRGELAGLTGIGERQARRVASALLERGVLTAGSPRAPLRLAFPAALAARWMPGLFPEQAEGA